MYHTQYTYIEEDNSEIPFFFIYDFFYQLIKNDLIQIRPEKVYQSRKEWRVHVRKNIQENGGQ